MEQNQNTSLFQLNLDAQNSYTLRSAASWAKVLGIVSLIMGILFVIFGIIAQQAISKYSDFDSYRYKSSGFSSNSLATMGLAIYVVLGLIYIISSIFALNTGNKISGGLRNNDQGMLNAGFAGARNFFAFWSILIIIGLLLVLVSLLGTLGR
ncbi:MAG TPA: hypothetical protein PKC72_11840 [Chitinophagaceae bacterium]|nr:hypothetical protein [Chitinophagaceae bacterium]